MKIANPIYDIVFKYLMEDERIARTILSALLKVDVVAVEVRPHEYSDDNRDTLSVFRIDFGATIRDDCGKEKLILIELQKTWLETETLRFRQYLGVHYSNPKNMLNDGNALPMVAVYLLGHKVGDVEEPVLYVSHQSLDYDGNVVTSARWLLKDLYQLTIPGISGFMYPKSTKEEDVYFVGKLLETIEYEKRIPVGTFKLTFHHSTDKRT